MNYYLQMAMGDGLGCTFAFDLQEFCVRFHHFPTKADSALKILTRAGYVEYTEEQDTPSRIQFMVSRDELYRYRSDEEADRVLALLMRSYTGLFADYVVISEDALARQAALSRRRIYEILLQFSRRQILHYIPGKKTPYLIYTRERIDSGRLVLSKEVYEDRKQSLSERIAAMVGYVSSEDQCRSRMLLAYFGEKDVADCGLCDVCLARKKRARAGMGERQQQQEAGRQVKELLREGALSIRQVLDRLPLDERLIHQAIEHLLDEEEIHFNHDNHTLSI
jgi:ATP-dependent DNA helicase RecQ